jgi:hypothetical protein
MLKFVVSGNNYITFDYSITSIARSYRPQSRILRVGGKGRGFRFVDLLHGSHIKADDLFTPSCEFHSPSASSGPFVLLIVISVLGVNFLDLLTSLISLLDLSYVLGVYFWTLRLCGGPIAPATPLPS